MRPIATDLTLPRTTSAPAPDRTDFAASHGFKSLKRIELSDHRRRWWARRSGRVAASVWAWLCALGFVVMCAYLLRPRVIDCGPRCTGSGKALSDIMSIESAAKEYALVHEGRYPEVLAQLVRPDGKGRTFIEGSRIPLDPWHNEYIYAAPTPDHPELRIASLGRDGEPGGEGDDADLDNLTLRRED